MRKTTAVLAVLVVLPLAALAQKPVTQAESVEISAKIEAIDKDVRLINVRNKNGLLETIYAGPDVKRFDELKVGDTVSVRYYESLALDIHKPGQPGSAPVSGEPSIARSSGPRPAATISQQRAATVTIQAIDPKLPWVSVLTDDGRTLSMKVDDKKVLEGLKAGDKVEITYTQAMMISVK